MILSGSHLIQQPTIRNPRTVAAWAISVSLLLALTACNIISPIAYIADGPPTKSALYTLPQRKIVIFLDDRGSVIPRTRLRRIITQSATRQLLQVERLVPAAIDPDAAVRIAQSETNNQLLSIDQIGAQAGADIIIYIQPQAFALISRGLPRPTAEFRVKVIDTATGQRLFPVGMGPSEFLLTVAMAVKPGSHFENADSIRTLEESLADFAGLRIAQIFYKHEPNPLDGERSR